MHWDHEEIDVDQTKAYVELLMRTKYWELRTVNIYIKQRQKLIEELEENEEYWKVTVTTCKFIFVIFSMRSFKVCLVC